jgi:hypothetical protein
VLRGGSKNIAAKGTVSVLASGEQIGPVLSGNAQYFAIRRAGGEYRVHGHRGTHVIGDSVCKTGPAFLFRQKDVLAKAARACKQILVPRGISGDSSITWTTVSCACDSCASDIAYSSACIEHSEKRWRTRCA